MSSCGVDEFDDIDTQTEIFEPEVVYVNDIITKARSTLSYDGVIVECILIAFPFSIVDMNGTKHDINDANDFNIIAVDSTITLVDFVYPLQIEDDIGISIIVSDLWELATHAAGCYPDSLILSSDIFPAYVINFQNSCYSIQYPARLQNIEGDIYTFPDERTFIQKHTAEPLYFVFPLTLIDIQNQVFIASDAFSLNQLLFACNGFDWQDTAFFQITQFATFACYEYVFPINVIILGQTTPISIPDAATLGNVFMQGRFMDYGYPLNLKTFNGQLVTANNQQELYDLSNECSVNGDFSVLLLKTKVYTTDPCYNLIFPFSVSKKSGINVNINSYTQINNLMLQDTSFGEFNTNYPVSIVFNDNNQIKALESFNDVIDTYISCE